MSTYEHTLFVKHDNGGNILIVSLYVNNLSTQVMIKLSSKKR